MSSLIFTIEKYKSFSSTFAVCFLVLIIGGASNLFAQYKGAPVKKDRLVQALRSKQLQTRDIVTIINRNGVDFRLTPDVKKTLIAAGARPEVVKAIANNPRFSSPNDNDSLVAKAKPIRKSKPAVVALPTPSYDDLLEQAIFSYQDQRNPRGAVRFLETAAKVRPENPAAYQMLGYVYLYGLNDFLQAEKSMQESFSNGGSAVFRVFHDDNGNFKHRCTGSLYISQDTLRFESDNNVHTFETSTASIDKIKLDTESSRTWKKHSIFKIFLKFGKEEAKFRFAPLTGEQEESKMVARFISASNPVKISSNSE